MADNCLPPAENRCEVTKTNVPKLRSASSAEGIAARRTLVAVRRDSAKAKRPSSCCTKRETPAPPPRVDISSVPCHV